MAELYEKLIINDDQEFECFSISRTGDHFEVIIKSDDFAAVKTALANIQYIDIYDREGFQKSRVTDFNGYSSINYISNYYVSTESGNSDAIIVTFKKADLSAKVLELDQKVNGVIDESSMIVAEYKEYRIAQSKLALEEYLISHPITSTAHGGVEGTYAITKEKQDLMSQQYLTYQIEKQVNPDKAMLTWNETGKECTIWNEVEFVQLIMEIKSRVSPLVSYQQSIESQIRGLSTKAEIAAVVIDYDSVKTTEGELNGENTEITA